MTEKMIDYVLAELDGYATIADNERARLLRGDIVSDALLQQLKTAVKLLEDVPEAEKDWHPGSNDRVLDLARTSTNFVPLRPPKAPNQEEWTSEDFCWLPSDFAIAEDGTVALASAYINNLHPERHASLYRIVEEVLSAFVPVFERVLGDVNREGGRHTNSPLFGDSGRLRPIECIWGRDERPYPKEEPESDEDIDDFNRRFWESIEKILPEANRYSGQLEDGFKPLANVHLTPSDPEYEGGNWHVEGMVNESLYYDEENITESELSFRVPTAEPSYHMQGDSECMRALNEECVQDIGAVVTKAGRALAWPNLFQHCVSFELADATKPGHRKILAFHLVDATKERIVSASDVPPQQAEWAAEAFRDAAEAGSVVGKRFDRALFSGDSDDS
ncbi:hypothetical protein C8R46DRAFT_1213023 [Mycena filopes]|nr:hypothetical protein C8R46DRAFT_1213023 [Mycena filopes]